MVDKRLYRSRDAVAGGVCAGMADYLSIDPIVVRIAAVALTAVSAGAFALAYLALWIMIPKAPDDHRPLDIEPEAVHSEHYGSIDWNARYGDAQGTSGGASRTAGVPDSAYPGSGHVPPQPPDACAWAWRSAAGPDNSQAAWTPPSWQTPSSPQVAAPPPTPEPPSTAFASSCCPPDDERSIGVKVALAIGSFLLFFGLLALLTTFVEGMAWWRFWPLILMIAGIVSMVVPGKSGRRMRQFTGGMMLFFLGATLLSMSMGIISWRSLGRMFEFLWPLLVMMAGCFVLGAALKAPALTLAGGLCFVAFCIVGVGWFSVPGAVDAIVVSVPFGWEHRFTLR